MMKTPLLAGRRLALICETSTESYSFGPDGTVAAILGEKNGPACAPIFRYRVLSADSIELLDGDGCSRPGRTSRSMAICCAPDATGKPRYSGSDEERLAENAKTGPSGPFFIAPIKGAIRLRGRPGA